jgi:uncharacterized membrane protein
MQAKPSPSTKDSNLVPGTVEKAPVQKRWLIAGTVGLGTLALLVFAPGSLLDKLFILLSGICAQRPAHTAFFDGQPLPMEARMIGIFSSFSLTLFFLWLIGRGRVIRLPRWPLTVAALALVVPVALDGLNATAYDAGLPTLYAPQLLLRIITGSLSGVGIAILTQPFFNRVVWKLAYRGGPLRNWREFFLALLIGTAVAVATLSGWSLFFWPLALLSAAGVIAILTMANLMIFAMLSKRENWASRPQDLLTPLALTYVFTLVELAVFAAIRISLIGAPV